MTGHRPRAPYLRRMKRLAALAVATMLAATPAVAGECVMLLHGLVRTSLSLKAMEVALQAFKPEPAATAALLSSETFETALGPVKFDETGANTISVHAFFEWQNGAFEEIAP